MSLIDHLEKLKYFNKLYGYKSLKEASKNIGISQVGLSKNISILEEILNTKLLLRSQNGISFTLEGEKLYKFSAKIIEDVLLFQTSISKNLVTMKPTSLSLVTYDSIAVYFIPEMYEYIKIFYPSVSLNIKIDHSRNIIDKINKRQIDLAIGVNLKANPSTYHIHKLFNDSFSLFISNKYKLNLDRARFIYHPYASDQNGKYCHEYLSKYLKNHDGVKSENFETIKSLTLNSVGIGVLPINVASDEVKSGRLQAITLPKFPQSFGIHKICLAYNHELLQTHSDLIYEMIRIGNSWSSKSIRIPL